MKVKSIPKFKAILCTLITAGIVICAIVIEQVGTVIFVSLVLMGLYGIFRYLIYEEIFLPYFQRVATKEET